MLEMSVVALPLQVPFKIIKKKKDVLFKTGSHYVALAGIRIYYVYQDGLKFTEISLSLSSKC